MNSFLFDKRVVRRNIEKGLISQQDYLNHLKGLEDVAEQSEPVAESLYGGDEDEKEADAEETGESATF